MLVNNLAITRLSKPRIDAICELIRNGSAARRLAGRVLPRRGQRPARGRDARRPSPTRARRSPRRWRAAPMACSTRSRRRICAAAAAPASRPDRNGRPAATRRAPAHFVVCNADEGEPGTFKDRVLLTSYADRVLAGMTLCAFVVGAKRGFLYLRGEYRYLLDHLQAVLARRRRRDLLGQRILGRDGIRLRHRNPPRRRRVRLRRGVGADRVARRQARDAAQPAAVSGHARLPRPADGREQRRDLRRGVADRAERRRVVFRASAPASRRARRSSASRATAPARHLRVPVRRDACAKCSPTAAPPTRRPCRSADRRAICVPAAEFDRRIAFEDLPTAGAFMVFDHSRDLFEVARNFVHFFAHESCGFCTPCRVGTSLLQEHDGQARERPRLAVRLRRDREDESAPAGDEPLRARALRVQPGARYDRQVPPGLRAAPGARANSSPPSTSTAR